MRPLAGLALWWGTGVGGRADTWPRGVCRRAQWDPRARRRQAAAAFAPMAACAAGLQPFKRVQARLMALNRLLRARYLRSTKCQGRGQAGCSLAQSSLGKLAPPLQTLVCVCALSHCLRVLQMHAAPQGYMP